MVDLTELPGIPDSIRILLREGGVESAELLASLETGEILARLDDAQRRRGLETRETGETGETRRPAIELIRAWQKTAREVLGRGVEAPVSEAKEVSAESLKAAGIDLDVIPVAEVVEAPPPERPEPRRTAPAAARPQLEDSLPVPPPSPLAGPGPGVQESGAGRGPRVAAEEVPGMAGSETPDPDRAALAREEEQSRCPVAFKPMEEAPAVAVKGERRNRGMSHPEAGLVRWSATVTVLAFLCSFFATVGMMVVGVMAAFFDVAFHWSVALVLLVIPVCLFAYVTQGTKARCRLCGQRLFVPKNCRKHERAARSIFGHTFAVARSAMFRANFRCMLCGTKMRLKD